MPEKIPVGDVFLAYLDSQASELVAGEAAVRRREDDSVHAMRSTARRIRSALRGYRAVLRKSAAQRLNRELRWLGQQLGEPRDAEVLRDRVLTALRSLPRFQGSEAELRPVEEELDSVYEQGHQQLLAELDSPRYWRLLDALEDFRRNPPLTEKARRPARKAGARIVEKAAHRMERSHRRAKKNRGTPEYGAALHEVRKDAKKLRHTVETVAGVRGKRARTVGKAAHRIQQALGEQRDAMAVCDFLQGLATGQDTPAGLKAACREVIADETRKAADAEAAYRKAYKKARRKTGGFSLG